MSHIAVLGSAGMLGNDLMRALHDHEVTGFTRATIDITDPKSLQHHLEGFDTVINAAAYTAVDKAESHEAEAFAVNAEGPQAIATVCASLGQRFVQVSTDYVFDGGETTPYPENHPRNPQSVYGRSKAAGEQNALLQNPDSTLIVRTAWLYGVTGSNFLTTMLKLATTHESVSVVTDQVGQPTWSWDVAEMIRLLVESPIRQGIFHATNSGQASWFDFAVSIFQKAGLDPRRVLPATSDHFPRPAQRPSWSVLGHDEWAIHQIPLPRDWGEAFGEAWETHFQHSYRGSAGR